MLVDVPSALLEIGRSVVNPKVLMKSIKILACFHNEKGRGPIVSKIVFAH